MAFKNGLNFAALGLALAMCGFAAAMGWYGQMWGLLTMALLASIWLIGLLWWNAARMARRLSEAGSARSSADTGETELVMQRLLLDAAPTPLTAVEGRTVRVLNRAARHLFGTDDRVVPPPAALVDPDAGSLFYEGRRWRIDRVAVPGTDRAMRSDAFLVALIDFEREDLAAEARASAELVEVLGHELLNGLAPIVSLAESAQEIAGHTPIDTDLLDEILGPLARRAEGLQRFASAYRSLARLPEPDLQPVRLRELANDLSRAFSGRWDDIVLSVSVPQDFVWAIDRDQIHQALWALLSNASQAVEGREDGRVGLALALEEAKLTIAVTDNGPGVPPERATHIFRPFHTTRPEGSGVGLWLARQIARAHGGRLELEGRHPTCFRMTLIA